MAEQRIGKILKELSHIDEKIRYSLSGKEQNSISRMRWTFERLEKSMELKLIKNNGYTLGERWKLLLGNTLLCRYCSGRFWWSGEIVDFNILGFDHKNPVSYTHLRAHETRHD